MCRLFYLVILIMMTVRSSCEDWDFFSSNNDLSLDDIEPNLPDDGSFANDFDLNIADDPSVNDDLSNIEEPYPIEEYSNNFLTAGNDLDCSSLSLLSRGVRARSDNSCAAEPEKYLIVKTDADVQKYWCSKTSILGFANIPVCNLLNAGVRPSEQSPWPDIDYSTLPTGFTTLSLCRKS